MTEQERKKGGGSKLSRSETVTVRLDPKLRYLAELASRKQRRTLSSFIEWAIEDSLSRVNIYEGNGYNGDNNISIAEQASFLWDVDDADRFVNLALKYDYLLTHEEQVLWKLIRENGYLWKGNYDKKNEGRWTWQLREESFLYKRLRDNWEIFNCVAKGEATRDVLPKWLEQKTTPDPEPEPDFNDDDIPF
jgi:hypothetical protein